MLLKIINMLKIKPSALISNADNLFYKLIKNFLRFDSYTIKKISTAKRIDNLSLNHSNL